MIRAANRETVAMNSDMPKYDSELIAIILATLGALLLVASALLLSLSESEHELGGIQAVSPEFGD